MAINSTAERNGWLDFRHRPGLSAIVQAKTEQQLWATAVKPRPMVESAIG